MHKLTLKAAQAQAKVIGFRIKFNAEWSEYLVYRIGTRAPQDHAATYFTTDLEDALATARASSDEPDDYWAPKGRSGWLRDGI